MPRLQGLIFDLDGTLLDSAPDLRQAINLMLAELSLSPLTLEEVKTMTGDGAMAFVQRALVATGKTPPPDIFPLVQNFIGHYRNIKPDPAQIYPGVIDLLKSYGKAGVKFGVCTNKQESATYRILEELNLRRYFEFIAGGDTFPTHKPNPDHLRGVIMGMDVEPEGCVFVGDGPNDVLAARGAKIPCVIITHGYGGIDDTLKTDRLIARFDELSQTLKDLGYTLN
ncbi:MAG: HAD-IA family hydrolase [Alphaproteobacteria bacterium]|nr:HAD-IA family hydrolase [Alphaproteobacteria bacterium]